MAVDISRYEKFLDVRNNAIKIIERDSVHCELKSEDEEPSNHVALGNSEAGGRTDESYSLEGAISPDINNGKGVIKIRHVGIITEPATILELERLIQEWDNRARELTAADPIRFPKTAFILAPIPQVIYGVSSMSIAVGGATTSKKFTRESILGRYDRAIKRARQAELVSHNNTLLRLLERERELLAKDNETHYRIRNTCGTETICTVTFKDGTTDRVRVPRVGVAFAAPYGGIEIRKPRSMSPRSDRLEHMGVEPLDCSLSGLAGLVYKESEIIKARAEYQLRNNK
ncbi:hypothetical protein [Aeromonas dhakensis]|uniref:hypothetical protein n=1 Tax=Aeromonas dhakensis TaxID=196024 RepID=UPI0024471675|nr:hypothetical protein [Aeromonas dhakensis]MDH0348203.1 hypothetical protein [Aeromonas dhakensis]